MLTLPHRLRLGAALLLLALLLAAPAHATVYAYDDDVVSSTATYLEAYFANVFTFGSESGQIIRNVRIRQVNPVGYVGGSGDVYIWSYDSGTGLPGSVLGTVPSVIVPAGSAWTIVDVTSLNIPAPADGKVFVGVLCADLEVGYDASGGANSYRRIPSGSWTQYGSGDLMIRVETGTSDSLLPTQPTEIKVWPNPPAYGDDIKATASGSTVPGGGDILRYRYQWATSMNGTTWSNWTEHPGRTLRAADTQPDMYVRARAKAIAAAGASAWRVGRTFRVRKLIGQSVPADLATNVPRTTRINIYLRFPMQQPSVNEHFTLKTAGGKLVNGTITWPTANQQLCFTPATPLAPATRYIAKIAAGSMRKTKTTIKLDESFSFRTSSEPVVLSYAPNTQQAGRRPTIRVTFDQDIAPGSVTADRFYLYKTTTPATHLTGPITVAGKVISFLPSVRLAAGTEYTVMVNRRIKSQAGIILGQNFTWKFRTAATTAALAVTASAAPAGENSQIMVTLTAPAEVQVEISNIAGRRVAMLTPRGLDEGLSTLLWNGRATTGLKVPQGQYLIRVTATGEDGQRVTQQITVMR